MRHKQTELLNRENTRLSYPLRCALDRHQTDGVYLNWNVLLPHCEIPQRIKNATDVDSAFRCKWQRLKPQFDRSRLQFCDLVRSPLRHDVNAEPRFVSFPCVMARRHL